MTRTMQAVSTDSFERIAARGAVELSRNIQELQTLSNGPQPYWPLIPGNSSCLLKCHSLLVFSACVHLIRHPQDAISHLFSRGSCISWFPRRFPDSLFVPRAGHLILIKPAACSDGSWMISWLSLRHTWCARDKGVSCRHWENPWFHRGQHKSLGPVKG